MTQKILIIDASAVINDFSTKYSDYRLVTTTKVVKELKSRGAIEDLEERIPKPDLIKFVSDIDKDLSDKTSEADKELLALALEFRAPVVTDDYGIQNIATKLGVEFIPVLEEGITKVIEWEYYCSGCRRKAGKSGVCKVCGGRIKRRERK
jgi:UPF0271 protein|tara:strand:+ start:34031 stop:34480 length:450 start_codon:yes stop_codon:yes gene_type:complete